MRVRRFRSRSLLAVVSSWILLIASTAAGAQGITQGWSLNGANTLRSSYYDVNGPAGSGPYPFQGDMYYDEFNLYFSKQDSPYDTWRGEISGVYNINDDYRSAHFGMVPERINLSRQNGDAAIPYRFDAGDLFSYYSYLTLQRSLKGLQVELQPELGSDGTRNSIILTSGVNEPDWRGISPGNNYVNGVSWLLQDRNWGSWSLNFVHNYRDGSTRLGTLDRSQFVYSLAAEKIFRLGSQILELEGEFAHFTGDHNGTAGPATGQDRSDNGFYAELRGHHRTLPWDYRIRVDRYGRDFRPVGAIVTPDRRSVELHSGWRFDTGISMRVRAQFFEDGFESSNQTITRTYGINLAGQLLKFIAADINGSLDAYIQNIRDKLRITDADVHTVNLNLNKPLTAGWTGEMNVFLQNISDSGSANADRFTRQLNLSADHAFTLGGLQGYVTPGILLRSIRKGGQDSNDWSPTLALSLNRGPHSLSVDYRGLMQNRLAASAGTDVDTHTFNVDYRYQHGPHQFGLEAGLFGRNPHPGASTDAYRISVFWTYQFDVPAAGAAPAGMRAAAVSEPSIAGGTLTIDLRDLAPGTTEQQVRKLLQAAGLEGGTEQGNFVVYEYPLLQDVFQRQRLAIEYAAGAVKRSAYIINFDDVGNRDTVMQTFERVRRTLIKNFGSPTRTVEEGDFTVDFVADVNNQRLIRLVEWETSSGTIRFGIPRRLDRQVRMEVQYAVSFPPPRQTLWSIQAVR